MRPTSAERPPSAPSLRFSTRQRLQQISTQQVYDVDSRNNLSTIESNTKSSPRVSIEDISEKTNQQRDLVPATPLRHLVFKKVTPGPVEVSIRCIFIRVGEIDTLNERYYAEVLLEASWEEPSFKSLQTRPFNPAINWTPELELMNGIGDLQDDITYSVHFNKHGFATVTEHHRLKGTLWERMELHHFPVDVQELSVSLTTSHSDKEMIFIRNLRKPSGVNRRVFTDEQEWFLFEHVDIEVTQEIDEYLDDGHNHPVVICSCHTARKYGYFIWNAYFLIFLITSASFTTFPIPLSNIHGRVQIACTLLLTSITFRWLCNKALPTISYLTAVDIYAIGNIFSLCLLNIYHGVIGYINFYNTSGVITSIQSLIIIDRYALGVFTILFFAYQIGTLIWMYLVPFKKRRLMIAKDNRHRSQTARKYPNEKSNFINLLPRTESKK